MMKVLEYLTTLLNLHKFSLTPGDRIRQTRRKWVNDINAWS